MMYAIYWFKNYVNEQGRYLIYAPNSGDDGYNITSGKLELGVNIAGTLTMTIPPTNPIWVRPVPWGDDSKPMTTMDQGDIILVYVIEDGISKEIWRGCVKSQNWDIYKNMTVTCEGTLAYFNDILLPEYNFYWTGVIAHAYNPDEGLSSINLDKLKDLFPDLSPDGIKDKIEDTVQNIIPSETFTPNLDAIGETMDKALSSVKEDEEDNVDRRITVYDFLVWILTIYNAQLTTGPNDQRKQIKIGFIDPVFKKDEYKINQKTTEYTIAWDAISSAILDVFGGIMYTSNWHQNENGVMVHDNINSYLYYYKDPPGTNSQIIQFGENLLNYEYEIDNTERVSRWYIFGKTKDENGKETIIDMSSVNNGKKFVSIPDGAFFGTISRVEYTDLTTPQELYDYGVAKLGKSALGAYTVTVEAVDLHLVDKDIESFEPGKTVQMIISNDLYTDRIDDLMIESISIDLLSPESSTYTFKKTGLTA